jgi:catechol 2,3-dioxygenase-like lactoylglutathione lyase family enzyme
MNKWEGLIVFLGTKDLAQTDKFYRELLDLGLYKDQGVCRIYDVPGGGRLAFCTHIPVTQVEKNPIITLLTDDVDGAYQRLCNGGFTPQHQPQENPRFKIYHFFVTDPNGYWVEVQQFLD